MCFFSKILLNETPYFYLKNALGIIYAIVDTNGQKVVKYSYDAWGNLLNKDVLNTSIGSINPFLGRFIQPADILTLIPSSINGLNLYNYANNNPISIHYNTTLASAGIVGGVEW